MRYYETFLPIKLGRRPCFVRVWVSMGLLTTALRKLSGDCIHLEQIPVNKHRIDNYITDLLIEKPNRLKAAWVEGRVAEDLREKHGVRSYRAYLSEREEVELDVEDFGTVLATLFQRPSVAGEPTRER